PRLPARGPEPPRPSLLRRSGSGLSPPGLDRVWLLCVERRREDRLPLLLAAGGPPHLSSPRGPGSRPRPPARARVALDAVPRPERVPQCPAARAHRAPIRPHRPPLSHSPPHRPPP